MNSRRFTVGTRGTVIVVNEPDAQRQMVLQRFQARGFRAHAAESGRVALQLAREQRPDVILMDMDRPTLDGWESTRRLKADPVTRHILVVALSEDTQTDRRNQAMRVGCDGFEAKPLDVDHLVASVESLLPAQGVVARAGAPPAVRLAPARRGATIRGARRHAGPRARAPTRPGCPATAATTAWPRWRLTRHLELARGFRPRRLLGRLARDHGRAAGRRRALAARLARPGPPRRRRVADVVARPAHHRRHARSSPASTGSGPAPARSAGWSRRGAAERDASGRPDAARRHAGRRHRAQRPRSAGRAARHRRACGPTSRALVQAARRDPDGALRAAARRPRSLRRPERAARPRHRRYAAARGAAPRGAVPARGRPGRPHRARTTAARARRPTSPCRRSAATSARWCSRTWPTRATPCASPPASTTRWRRRSRWPDSGSSPR